MLPSIIGNLQLFGRRVTSIIAEAGAAEKAAVIAKKDGVNNRICLVSVNFMVVCGS